jgi:hypothetical protein
LLNQVHDSIAIVLRNISIDSNNLSNDITTALEAILLAQKFAKKPELRSRIESDIKQLSANRLIANINSKARSSSGCLVLLFVPSIVAISAFFHFIKIFI